MCWEGWRAVGLFIHQAPEVHVMAAQRQQAFPCIPGLLMEEAYALLDVPLTKVYGGIESFVSNQNNIKAI